MKQIYLDPYCYPGTSVLKNLADIRDGHLLENRQRLYAARDRAVMKADFSALAEIFASILSVR